MYKYLIIIFVQCVISLKSQDTLNSAFIKLKDGKMVVGKLLEYNYYDKKIVLDNITYKSKDALFFRSAEGKLHARIGDALVSTLYESIKEKDSVNFYLVNSGGMDPNTTTGYRSVNLYFTNKFSKPKRVNAKYFVNLMKDDPIADSYIRSANGARITSNICFTIAAGLLIGGLGHEIVSSNPNMTMARSVETFGSVMIIGGIITNKIKGSSLRKALNKYYDLGIE